LVEARAHEVCAGRAMSLGILASRANDDKRNLLERRGFRPTRSVLRMRIDLSTEPETEPPVPVGVAIRPFALEDEAEVRAVWRDAFGNHGRFSSPRMEEWLQSRFVHPAFDPALWRVAVDGDDIVGAILVFDVGQTGYTSTVGVRASHRGRRIGPALLRAAFGALRERGQMRVIVSLDDDADAAVLAVYEAAGMRIHERHDLFVKRLD
jgi:ribosomal protein S18 acetylase RimI-like enzyme